MDRIGLISEPPAIRERTARCRNALGLGAAAIALTALSAPAHGTAFTVTKLVTDDQAINTALIADPGLKNPWGVSFSPSNAFWISNNGTGTSTLYSVDPTTNATSKVGLTVTIPGAGNPTGQVFNSSASNFDGNSFLFVSEDGTVSGWRNSLGTTAAILKPGAPTNIYKGAALATIGSNEYLYAANFKAGTIDVLKGTSGAPALTGNFSAPALPAGYAPFNIENIGGDLYVSYAVQDAAKEDDVKGAGHGAIDVFDTEGKFVNRLTSGGPLNSPWGMVVAPSSFAEFAGKLLVGNFGDGTINAFDPATGASLGVVTGTDGKPISIDGLWALTAGNGGQAGSALSLYFTAGPNDETNGLFGVLRAVPEPSTYALLGIGLLGVLVARRRRLS
ncbi:MAG: TIGR03118 family protein [Betaproteobacteria bacterium]